MRNKDNPRLKNPEYTRNLLECSVLVCKYLEPLMADSIQNQQMRNVYVTTGLKPAYKALRDSINRIVEDDSDKTDYNQLELEL